MKELKIAILGLGEAGSHFANDLAQSGISVSGWDPELTKQLDEKVIFANSNSDAVKDADVIFSTNLTSVSVEVAKEVLSSIKPNAFYCEMNTSAPNVKQKIQGILQQTSCRMIDLAIMAPVPPSGIKTPMLASGKHATAFIQQVKGVLEVEYLEGNVGDAAQHKLLRSIVYKGFAAVISEAVAAGQQLGLEGHIRSQIHSIIGENDALIDRFVEGSKKHATRRMHEMEAVVEMLKANELKSTISAATVEHLRDLQSDKASGSQMPTDLSELRKAFADIPGTYVMTPEHSTMGYHLNMFCMSLNQDKNREEFRKDERAYVDKYDMTEEQKQAVLNREWLELLRLGGNIYYTFKIAIFDRKSMQHVGGKMSGLTESEFQEMMLSGGRSIIGNRSKQDRHS